MCIWQQDEQDGEGKLSLLEGDVSGMEGIPPLALEYSGKHQNTKGTLLSMKRSNAE